MDDKMAYKPHMGFGSCTQASAYQMKGEGGGSWSMERDLVIRKMHLIAAPSATHATFYMYINTKGVAS